MNLRMFGIAVSYSGNSLLAAISVVLLFGLVVLVVLPLAVVMAVSTLVQVPMVYSWGSWGAAIFILAVFTRTDD